MITRFFNFLKIISNPFFDKYSNHFSILFTTFVSFLIASLTYPSCLFYILTVFSFGGLLAILLYFWFNDFVPIKLSKSEFTINFSNEVNLSYFKIPSLMISENISLQLFLKVKLSYFFKNNMKKYDSYTIIIEKDKSFNVQSTPEYVKDEDNEDKSRSKSYYFLVQKYAGQDDLDFEFNISCSDTININKSFKIYIEYGDVHKNIIDGNFDDISFKNNFFDEKFFITDLK